MTAQWLLILYGMIAGLMLVYLCDGRTVISIIYRHDGNNNMNKISVNVVIFQIWIRIKDIDLHNGEG